MTIVPLVRVTFYGVLADKERVLEGLQDLGCLHLVPLAPARPGAAEGPPPAARNALRFLLACRERRRQIHDPARFDAGAVQDEALEIQALMRAREDERDALRRRIEVLRPWGDFVTPAPQELQGLKLWFYVIPNYRMRIMREVRLVWQEVKRDNRFSYVVVIAHERPEGVPGVAIEPGARPLSALVRRLEEVEIELEDLAARRVALTRFCDLFAESLHRLEDQAERVHAARQTHDAEPLFALQGWAPRHKLEDLERHAHASGLALVVAKVHADETPPTLLENPAPVAGGQELVSFYSTPAYWNWDPSAAVFVSFVVFFAMILSDAGYALVWGVLLALFWRRLEGSSAGRGLQPLFAAMAIVAFIWGVLVGSYFGVPPAPGSLLSRAAVLDLDDYETMMRLSVLVGVVHVVAANLGRAWALLPQQTALAPVGWSLIVLGGTVLWIGSDVTVDALAWTGAWMTGAGALAVLLFSSAQTVLWRRLLAGVLALTRLPTAFGDVLSYLRLFALGLASTSLALVFNDLAGSVASVPGVGVLLAILIIVLGHALNFALAVVGGFVHGLRLNFIEFFNWSLAGDGYPFRPFAKKETITWTRS